MVFIDFFGIQVPFEEVHKMSVPSPTDDSADLVEMKQSFRRVWRVAFLMAIATAVPVALYVDKYPWLVAVAIALGALVGICSLALPHTSRVPVVMAKDVIRLMPSATSGWVVVYAKTSHGHITTFRAPHHGLLVEQAQNSALTYPTAASAGGMVGLVGLTPARA